MCSEVRSEADRDRCECSQREGRLCEVDEARNEDCSFGAQRKHRIYP